MLTLTNVNRSEYGVVTIDLGSLIKQMAWLAGLGLSLCDEQEGLLNLLGAIRDLGDPDSIDELWDQLGDTPVDDEGRIQEVFRHFPVGTDREDIWHWFEAEYGVSVADLMGIHAVLGALVGVGAAAEAEGCDMENLIAEAEYREDR